MTTPHIIIRDASPDDIPFLVNANNVVNDKSNLTRADTTLARRLKSDFFPNTTQSDARILIAEIDGAPAGMIVFSAVYFMTEGNCIWVTNMFTDPVYQKMGIGTKLMDAVREIARDQHCAVIGFMEDENNTPAKNFAHHNGAKEMDNLRYYYINIDR